MAGSKSFFVHPQAWEDIDAADEWYFQRSPEASDSFIVKLSKGSLKLLNFGLNTCMAPGA